MGQPGPIVGTHFQFNYGTVRMQADAVHSFHARHWIMVAAPYGLRTVSVFFDAGINREESCRAMMLRPIEFDAAANPWACQANEGGLNHGLIIDEIKAVGFVLDGVNSSADFRQD